jgi:hypothetical protein
MRDKIDRATYDEKIRELGYILDSDGQDVLDLLKQLPPPSDIVRMMVRDAADENLVATFKLDTDFTKKFTGKVEEWARQQGIDPQYMQFLWRSHWSIPAPGQLANMLHRLSRLPRGDPAFVDVAIIRQAMEQQDIAPFWIDKFIAISYAPLTRIDARRSYEIGALDDAGLIEAYLNLGYALPQAQQLLAFNKIAATLKFARSPHVKQYANGELNDTEFDDLLHAEGATQQAVDYAHQVANLEGVKLRRRRCLKAFRLRFLQGDISDNRILDFIREQGLSDAQAREHLAGWECERNARGKAIPAGELCDLYERGALTIPELTSRLQKVGYNYDDSVMLARRCAARVQEHITKEEAKQLAQQERDEEKTQNKLQSQANKDEAARRRAEQNVLRMQRLALARTKRIQEAALNFSKHADVSLPSAVDTISGLVDTFLSHTLYTRDEIIQALLVESRSRQADSQDSLVAAVSAALRV